MYVGQTTNCYARWMKHKSLARNVESLQYKSHLYNAMKKYGEDNFHFKVIEECDYKILDKREKYWINELQTLEPNGYNIRNGGKKLFGNDNPFYGKHHTEKTKEKISIKNSGRIVSDDERKKRKLINKGELNPFYGKHHTEDTKEKIKETAKQNGTYKKFSDRMKKNNPNDGSLFRKPVVMYNSEFKILNIFESATEAGKYIKNKGLSSAKVPSNSISDVCRGIQKTAYGFLWKYLNFNSSENK